MNIEVEVRSLLTKEEYERLLVFFRKEGKFIEEDDQVSYYFDTEQDLRIQKIILFKNLAQRRKAP